MKAAKKAAKNENESREDEKVKKNEMNNFKFCPKLQ